MSGFPRELSSRAWFRYGIAALAVAAAFVLRRALTSQVGESLPTYITFYPAVMVAAVLGGVGPGLLATVLTLAAVDWWLVSPQAPFWHGHPAEIVGVVLFSLMGAFISGFVKAYHGAREKAARYDREQALRESQQALRDSEAQYRAIFEVASVGIVQVEPQTGRLLAFNDRYREITGYTTEELRACRFAGLTHPDDRDGDWDLFSRAVRGESADYRNEKRYVRKDGTTIWVRLNASFIRDAAGQALWAVAVCEDVTQRRQTENALRASERRFRQVAESLPQLVWTCAADGPCDYLSPQWVRYTGRSEAEQLGYGWLEQLHPDDRHHVIDLWQATAARGEDFEIEFRIRRHDGAHRWFRTLAVPLRDEAGQVVKWFGSNTDIEDLKQTEEALRRAHARLVLAQRSAGAGTWDWDMKTGQLDWSPELFHLFGLDPARAEATFDTWRRLIHPEDLAQADARIEAAIRTRSRLASDYRILLPTGEERWISALGEVAYDAGGQPLRMSGICLDITRRRQAETALARQSEELRLILDSTPAFIFFKDRENRFVRVNRAFADIMSIPKERLEGRSLSDLYPPEQAEAYWRDDQTVMRSGQPKRNIVEPMRTPVGERWVQTDKVLCRDGQGDVIGVIGFSVDITERREAEEALRWSARRHELLSNTAARLLQSQDAQGLVEDLCRQVMEFLDCQVFFNYLADEETQRLRLNACAGIPDESVRQIQWLDYGVAVCGCVARDGERITVEDIQNTPDARTTLVKSYGIQAYCCHPLKVQGRILGTLSFGTRARPRFRPEEIEVMKAVADLVASAMCRILTERALRQSREDLAHAQAVGQIGSWRLDTRHNVLTWSDENYRIFGVPKGTPLTYQTFLGVVHPEDRPEVDARWQAALRGEPYDIQHRLIVGGQVRWVHEKASLEFDEAGSLLGGFGISQDISELKQVQQELEQNRARLAWVLEKTGVGMWLNELPLGRLNWDDQTRWLFFVGPETEPTIELFWSRLHPDDRAATRQAIEHAFRTRTLYSIEHRVVHPETGEVRWIRSAGQATYAPDGTPTRFDGINYDITARKKGETALARARAELERKVEERTAELRHTMQLVEAERQRFRQVLDRLPAYLVLLSPDHRVPFANRFFEERFGKADGRRCYEYLFKRSSPCQNCESFKAFQTGTPHRWEWIGPDGRTYEIFDSPFTDVDGASLVLEVGMDVSERKAAEQAQQKLRDELARFSRITTAGQLAASLAHELNQPLGAIVCNVQAVQNLLAQEPRDFAEIRESLADIEADGKRAGQVIHQLRSLFQKTGQTGAVLQLNEVLRKTVDLLHSEFLLKGLDVHLELDPNLPSLRGREVELQQVVLNLVTNAIEAMGSDPAGGRLLSVRTFRDGPHAIRLSVRDSGPGLKAEHLPRIFEPFYSTKASGMGMGLAISHSIVEGHGGRLWAENHPERGAIFHCSLPLTPDTSS